MRLLFSKPRDSCLIFPYGVGAWKSGEIKDIEVKKAKKLLDTFGLFLRKVDEQVSGRRRVVRDEIQTKGRYERS
jgi:hypothetical protein